MLGSQALEIAIGLITLFLLASIMLTALTEAIEAKLKTRAADLERALQHLLEDPAKVSGNALEDFYKHPLIDSLFPQEYKTRIESWWLAGRPRARNLPSYIPRELFSAAALDLAQSSEGSARLKQVVDSLKSRYGGDTARIEAQLEGWFDGAMDRAAGWYKRRTQRLLFWLGLISAIVLNLNPFAVAQYLAQTPEARQGLVELAQKVSESDAAQTASASTDEASAADASSDEEAPAADTPADEEALAADATAEAEEPSPDETAAAEAEPPATETATTPSTGNVPCASRTPEWTDVAACQTALAQAGLPIGWSEVAVKRTFPGEGANWWAWTKAITIALAGWALMGLGATLGAPFWFDVLNKVMVVRSTVKPHEKSGDEGSEDRAAPQRNEAVEGAPGDTAPAPSPQKPAETDDDGAIG